MKKFSKISNSPVGVPPVIKNELSKSDELKICIRSIMDSYLGIEMNGPILKFQGAEVIGQDKVVEAIMDMIDELSNKKTIKILENMKAVTNDWVMLDDKINELKEYNIVITDSNMVAHKNKIKSLYNKLKNEPELMLENIKLRVDKINSTSVAKSGAIASNLLADDTNNNIFKKISNLYKNRAIELDNE